MKSVMDRSIMCTCCLIRKPCSEFMKLNTNVTLLSGDSIVHNRFRH